MICIQLSVEIIKLSLSLDFSTGKMLFSTSRTGRRFHTVVQVAGEGGIGDDEVVEVGVLLECWKISSSMCKWPGGEVATSDTAAGDRYQSEHLFTAQPATRCFIGVWIQSVAE